jgi:hypothetical protein
MGRQALLNKSDVVSQLGGWTVQTVLVDSQTSDFQIQASATESRVSQPRLKFRKCGHDSQPEQLRSSLLHDLTRRTLLLPRCLTTPSGLRPRMNLPLRYRRSITTKVMSSD